ncbi:MAG TPA: alkaline phosphatase D family protein [Pyrinomonadaceae bacterium]|jgi:alkaline phosphatase D|nr:alkaline phosphatase D family protein [Pyrinomonadaceae bacterium]
MSRVNRREFIKQAASCGAALVWCSMGAHASTARWQERRDLFPQGVASGDPASGSVILWARRPPVSQAAEKLTVEVAEDSAFRRVIAKSVTPISGDADWTCRVLVAGLKPRTVYWYRFTDEHGFGSRVGRTVTAPADRDKRPVNFAFVSCQNVQQGACNAYRRMIWEDERRPADEQLGFVLHLGDFVYEIVWYPEDRPKGMYARRLRDLVRYESGEKIKDFHVPTTLDDYRNLYRAYLLDPDLQDARAHFPFVCMWDNHEFSWLGWQSQQNFGSSRPAQTVKVAANQAWFEYQPGRFLKPDKRLLEHFQAPRVSNTPLKNFDDHGLGLEENNLAAINSLKTYRAFRYGKNVEMILTDNRSYQSESLSLKPLFEPFQVPDFPAESEEIFLTLDAGKTFNHGNPPATISFKGKELPNPRRDAAPQSVLGSVQKRWFLSRLRESQAAWKIWGNSFGMLDLRLDFQNLPPEMKPQWTYPGYGLLSVADWSGYRTERNEILAVLRREKITGLITVVGDRHAFQAGVLSEALPPHEFKPVAAEFITGSISAPGGAEAAEYNLPKDYPLRPIYLHQAAPDSPVRPAINLSLMHGVRAALALQKTGDLKQALAARNPANAPHLSFMDMSGHGYTTVRASATDIEVEFVCIPRPLERSDRADGGDLRYRVAHRVKRWKSGEAPELLRTKTEGELPLII